MKDLMEKYNNKVLITKVNDALCKYYIKCKEGYILEGNCLLGKYKDDLFEDNIKTIDMYCYNLREAKSVLSTLKEI